MDLLVARRPRAGHHGRPGHPRGPGRRLRRPRGHRPRRQGHPLARTGRRRDPPRAAARPSPAAGRPSIRLVLIAVAVALGVGLLLTTLAGINAVDAQNARYAWLETGIRPTRRRRRRPARDPLWWRLRADTSTASPSAGSTSPPPGRGPPSRPGMHRAARARGVLRLARAGRRCCADAPPTSSPTATPAGWSARSATAALPAPDSLVVVVGHTAGRAVRTTQAPSRSPASAPTPPSECNGLPASRSASTPTASTSCSSVVAAALLFPVLIFIGDGDPAVGRPPRAAVRRDAAGRRHARGRSRSSPPWSRPSPRSPASSPGFGAVLRAAPAARRRSRSPARRSSPATCR